jgi:hypothetical protein
MMSTCSPLRGLPMERKKMRKTTTGKTALKPMKILVQVKITLNRLINVSGFKGLSHGIFYSFILNNVSSPARHA